MARLTDNVLASRIALPHNTCISYSLFRPDSTCIYPHDFIEHARRSILSRNLISSNILDALLTSVYIGPEPFIYVFNITGQSLDSLHFDGLAVAERSSFSPPSVSLLLPTADKRNAYSHFLEAVRSRIIDDIVAASTKSLKFRQVKRFKNGFLLSQPSSVSDWEYKVITRPLIFCQLQVCFSYLSTGVPSHIVIYPMLLPTSFLDISRSLPLPPGTPITLLPYGTPAFFLACYTGPTTGLTKQFRLSLQGMGAGEWESPSRTPCASNVDTPVSDNAHQVSTFIIGWIKVENKQGEDKGITIIYPTSLCLSYIPSSTPRAPLDYIPELPAPLQPSPQAPIDMPSVSAVTQSGPPIANPTGTLAAFDPRRPCFVTSPTPESLHSLRSLTLSKSLDFRQVATEVGGYVDAVARERERERERLKREREGGLSSSPKLARTTATTPVSAPTPMAVDVTITSAPVSLATQVSPPVMPGSTSQQYLQPPMPIQNFYPSPPQSNPIVVPTTTGKTSPVVDSTAPFPPAVETPITSTTAALAPPLPITSSSSGSSNGYDPFGPMDTTWTQPAQNYLGMEMEMDFGMDDMGMDFGLNIASVANNSGSRAAYNDSRGNIEFEDAFTDDDFSFFDRPSRAAAVVAPPRFTQSRTASGSGTHSLSVSSLPAGGTMSPPLFNDISSSGPGPPNHSHSSSHNQQMWTPSFMEGFTPRSVDHNDSIPPDLLPSSPGQTPDTHSAPATPNVHLEYDAAIKRPSASNLFEPIPFAPYHRAVDGKYAFGKFALPSPPTEADLDESVSISLPSSPNGPNGWRCHYNAVTDPRIGVVRKLIGVKRKTIFQQGIRSPPNKCSWVRAYEEWEKPASEPEVKTDMESEDDEEDLDDIDSPLMSRPTTPAPSYLPLGPTLLHTQFQHSQLLPLSTSLRPPGAAVAPINLIATNPPLSVPTPVSPAATMGQASEKSKSLEAAAFAVAAEVVENPIWAETWRANIVGAKQTPSVWSTDIKAVSQLLEAVSSLESPVDMNSLFGLDTSNGSQPLETPMVSIGKGDAVIHVLPTALRFWEKLGLGPKGGRKDLSAFVIFEEDGEQRQIQMENWLVSVGNAYQGKHFGSLSPGKSSICSKDGLFPLRLDSSFRKSLSVFMSSLTPPQPTLIVFLVLPVAVMTLSSPILRQILSASKKVLSTFTASQIVFEFVPEQFISNSMEKSSPYDSALDLLSSSVYNRILVPIDRTMARRIDEHGEPIRSFMSPMITLSRSLCNKVSYVRAAHTSLDVMDRYTLLHVAYHLTACGKWILASCVDQRGEAYDLGVWLTQSPGASDGEPEVSDEEYAVRKVWNFAMQFAKRANIEWRVVFARLGAMNEQEMSAWTTHLAVHVLNSREQPPLHQSVVCVEPDAPWLFIPSSKPNIVPPRRSNPPTRSSPSSPKHHSVFTDTSTTIHALFPSNHMTILLPPSHTDLGLSQSFIPEPALTSLPSSPAPQPAISPTTNTVVAQTMSAISPPIILSDDYSADSCSRPHPITLMPLSTTTLIGVPASSSLACIRMTHIHLLCTFHSYSYTHSPQVSSCPVPDNQQLHRDITKNYHELAILAKVRWKLGGNSVLPFHLAAVDAMRMSLDRAWDPLEVGGDP